MKHEFQEIFKDEKTGKMRVRTKNTEPSLTQQQFKDECDINTIMKKYADTGEFKHVTSKTGFYADFLGIKDYQGMVEQVRRAEEAFMTLPGEVRARFANDPGSLITFLKDSKNKDEAIKLGLIDKPADTPAPPPKKEA